MARLSSEIIGGKFRTITLSGSDFDNGKKIGKFSKKYIRQVLTHDDGLLKEVKKNNSGLIDRLSKKMQVKYPEIIQELKGIAEGASVDFRDIFLENCPELLRKEDGCSSAVVKNKSGIFHIHNEDEEGWRDKKGFVLLEYHRKNFSYTAFAYPAELCGNAFGWNSAGLFFSVNYLATNKINLGGTPRYFVARKLLEQKTLAEAIKHLKSPDDASGFHYLISDAKTGKIVSVEKSLNKISVQSVSSFYFHANHYVHQKFNILGKNRSISSGARFHILEKKWSKNIKPEEAINLFRTELLRPLNKQDDSKTFATVVFKLSSDKLSK